MKLTNVDHIGIAVSNLQESLAFWQETLGIDLHGLRRLLRLAPARNLRGSQCCHTHAGLHGLHHTKAAGKALALPSKRQPRR